MAAVCIRRRGENDMRWQITCPFCKKEFGYDEDGQKSKIAQIRGELYAVKKHIAELKTYYKTPDIKNELRRCGLKEAKLCQALSAEKEKGLAYRERCEIAKFQIFKDVVRDRLGEDEFQKLIEKAESELEAYDIGNMMRGEYTRSQHLAHVTSINKI